MIWPVFYRKWIIRVMKADNLKMINFGTNVYVLASQSSWPEFSGPC